MIRQVKLLGRPFLISKLRPAWFTDLLSTIALPLAETRLKVLPVIRPLNHSGVARRAAVAIAHVGADRARAGWTRIVDDNSHQLVGCGTRRGTWVGVRDRADKLAADGGGRRRGPAGGGPPGPHRRRTGQAQEGASPECVVSPSAFRQFPVGLEGSLRPSNRLNLQLSLRLHRDARGIANPDRKPTRHKIALRGERRGSPPLHLLSLVEGCASTTLNMVWLPDTRHQG
jgi:hypothetical protein